jgi:uncharacterized membrane protein YhhN
LQITHILFWLVSLLNLAGEWLHYPMLRLVTKPLLMIVLGIWYFQNTASGRTSTHKLILTAFAFSWGGDVLLMGSSELHFLLGLVSFLITHLLYITGFVKEIKPVEGEILIKRNPLTALPVVLLFAGLLILVYGSIPAEMKIPVVIYASVITAMVLTTLNRYRKVSEESFRLVFAGALLFMLSDSLIALNKFYFSGNMPQASFLIMLLYITGQYLIARGTLKTGRAP